MLSRKPDFESGCGLEGFWKREVDSLFFFGCDDENSLKKGL
jgi:hypothetical protein